MDINRLIQYVHKEVPLTWESLIETEELLSNYPWFQVGSILYLENLEEVDPALFQEKFAEFSLFVNPRQFLMQRTIREGKKVQAEQNEKEVEKTSGRNDLRDNIIRALRNQPLASSEKEKTGSVIGIPNLEAAVNPAHSAYERFSGKNFFEFDQSRKIEHAKMLEGIAYFDLSKMETEMLDFSYPSERVAGPDKKEALIDSFLKNVPESGLRIRPDNSKLKQESEPVDYSEKGTQVNDDLLTETLARIFIKQERYEQAIAVYEKLCLKYPKKNSYFAEQIKKINQQRKKK